LAAAKAEMEAAIARFKALEQGLQKARGDLEGHARAVADAHKKKEAAAADEGRKKGEEVRFLLLCIERASCFWQSKAAEAAAKINAEMQAAELLKHTAEANIASLTKQASAAARRRVIHDDVRGVHGGGDGVDGHVAAIKTAEITVIFICVCARRWRRWSAAELKKPLTST
jgi:hypothetical protein